MGKLKGLEIINQRLMYIPQPGDRAEFIKLVESEVKEFNNARAGMDSKELERLKQMGDLISTMVQKKANCPSEGCKGILEPQDNYYQCTECRTKFVIIAVE